MPFTVAGIGEILWDLLPSGKRLGGAPANFCYHAQALGAKAFVVSRIGGDQPGKEIAMELESLGLSNRYITKDNEHPTGSVSVTIDNKGVPDYVIHKDVAWDFITLDDCAIDLARSADAVCFGTLAQRSAISRKSITTFLHLAKESALRICDINFRMDYYSLELIESSIALCNVLKINSDELGVLARLFSLAGNEKEVLSALMERYDLDLIALTRGANGSILNTPGEISEHPGFPAEVCDTVGAGDAFCAAMALGILKSEPLSQINETANRIASFVCGSVGATPRHDPLF